MYVGTESAKQLQTKSCFNAFHRNKISDNYISIEHKRRINVDNGVNIYYIFLRSDETRIHLKIFVNFCDKQI